VTNSGIFSLEEGSRLFINTKLINTSTLLVNGSLGMYGGDNTSIRNTGMISVATRGTVDESAFINNQRGTIFVGNDGIFLVDGGTLVL
jgi:hypothetical protein